LLVLSDPVPADVTVYKLGTAQVQTGLLGWVVGYGASYGHQGVTSGSDVFRAGRAAVQYSGANTLNMGAPSCHCSGDSGGPGFGCENGELVIIGVVHGGNGSCIPTLGGYYTAVSAQYDWIKTNVLEATGTDIDTVSYSGAYGNLACSGGTTASPTTSGGTAAPTTAAPTGTAPTAASPTTAAPTTADQASVDDDGGGGGGDGGGGGGGGGVSTGVVAGAAAGGGAALLIAGGLAWHCLRAKNVDSMRDNKISNV